MPAIISAVARAGAVAAGYVPLRLAVDLNDLNFTTRMQGSAPYAAHISELPPIRDAQFPNARTCSDKTRTNVYLIMSASLQQGRSITGISHRFGIDFRHHFNLY